MFDQLSERLQGAFKTLTGRGKLSEANIEEALREVRRALLEADVNFKVARSFVDDVKARAIGEEVLRSLTPGQQVVRIVHEELVKLLGGSAEPFRMPSASPAVIMVVGLQGSGKTTFCAKFARYVRKRGRSPLLAAADTYRPAAQEQLRTLASQLGVPVHVGPKGADPVAITAGALVEARSSGADIVILDTAGRLHVDTVMMAELDRIKEATGPQEILLVLDSMTGQDAVNVAQEFAERLDFTGAVLTKLDGDTRGGAAVSLKAVTGKPIRFAGVGEKLDALEGFHPDRMASRILGMGDVLTLVERAQEVADLDQAAKLEEKLRKQSRAAAGREEDGASGSARGDDPRDEQDGGRGGRREGARPSRGDRQLDDAGGEKAPERDRREPEEADRAWKRNDGPGRESAPQAVRDDEEDDEAVREAREAGEAPDGIAVRHVTATRRRWTASGVPDTARGERGG